MYRSINAIFLLVVLNTLVDGNVVRPFIPRLYGRVAGGENTTIEGYPYQVSVRVFGIHICSGSIIKERVIVTAAHCIHPILPARSYSVQYGTSVIGGSSNIINADRFIQNEKFNSSNYDNDIGLIFLLFDIPYSAAARPIELASVAPETGKSVIITGWGSLAEGSPNALILQRVTVQIIDKSICQQQYIGVNDITESMLCAGVDGGGKDACKNDSGGPLVSDGQLVGIISFGRGCARSNYPGVYTNIAFFKNWIESNMTT